MGRYIKQLKVSVHHQGCSACLSSEKFPEITLEQACPPSYLRKREHQVDYEILYRVYAPTKGDLDSYLKALKGLKGVTLLEVLKRWDNEALILVRTKDSSSSYSKVLQSNVICSSPVIIKNGFEQYEVVSTDPDQMRRMLSELSDVGQMKVLRIGDFERLHTGLKLTRKQEEALELAFSQGYYKWPKRVTLEELAATQNISRRSLQERLRRAEAKLMPHFLEQLIKNRNQPRP